MKLFSRRLDFEAPESALWSAERRRRHSGATILDLTVTNPTLVGLPTYEGAAGERLAAALAAPGVARYHPEPLGPRAARAAIAAEHSRSGAVVDPEQVVLTASSSESYGLLFKLLCDPEDLVLVPAPSYPLFDFLARLEGVCLDTYRLGHGFGRDWHLDWSALEPASARAVVVVNPNNPTGSFLQRDDHRRLVDSCAAAGVALIADEVFSDYALDPSPEAVRTVLAGPAPPALTFCLGGLSKSCGLPQMKLGWITVRGPHSLVAAALSRLELIADTYLSVGAPVTAALPTLLALGADNRAAILSRLRENRAVLAAGDRSGVDVLPAEGGWSAILRVPAVLSEEAWALVLLEEDGVLVQPGYFFDLEGLGATLVISLLVPPPDLEQGLRKIAGRVAALSS